MSVAFQCFRITFGTCSAMWFCCLGLFFGHFYWNLQCRVVLLSRIFWSLVGLLFSNEILGFFVVLGLLLLFSGLLLGLLLGLFLLFLGLLSVS